MFAQRLREEMAVIRNLFTLREALLYPSGTANRDYRFAYTSRSCRKPRHFRDCWQAAQHRGFPDHAGSPLCVYVNTNDHDQ